MAGLIAKLGAGSLLMALGTVMLPRTGMGREERPATEQAAIAVSERSTDRAPASSLMEEEEAARAAIGDADPRELARTSLMAEYASSTLERLVRAEAGDPEKLDEATLGPLLDKYIPIALREAEQWAQSIDPSTIPLDGINPKRECTSKFERFKCDYEETCNYKNGRGTAYCLVTNCGEGKCPTCPSLFNLDGLIVHGWCTYGCQQGTALVGTKVVIHFALVGKKSRCLALETPVP